MSSPSSIPYPDRIVAALCELVPPFHFHPRIVPDAQAGCECILIFALTPDGTVHGGYELGCNHAARDLFQDTLTLARFFLKARDQAEAMFHPPTVWALWNASGIPNRAG